VLLEISQLITNNKNYPKKALQKRIYGLFRCKNEIMILFNFLSQYLLFQKTNHILLNFLKNKSYFIQYFLNKLYFIQFF
jgi:hypothetical protein